MSQQPVILRTRKELNEFTQNIRDEEKTISYVPTMGALHEGHMSLVKAGFEKSDVVIVSIFVNPTQFGPNEDLDAYPRVLDKDTEICAKNGVAAIYTPSVEEMYPEGFSTKISVAGVSEGLCGAARPGHFDGVATVVTKLIMQVKPDCTMFGLKDYQQFKVIDRMNKDLDLGFNLVGVQTAREQETGLALSSRNAYLDADQYKVAIQLNKIIKQVADKVRDTDQDLKDIIAEGKKALTEAGFEKIDYLEICNANDLSPVNQKSNNIDYQVLAAAKIGRARLIDNFKV